MSAKHPTTDMERVTCLGYFLTYSRETSAFKTTELTKLNTEAAGPKLSYPIRMISSQLAEWATNGTGCWRG